MIDFTRPDRMIAISKSGYRMNNPNNRCVFNANVCVKSRGKIWYGDLDLAVDGPELQRLANELSEPVFVLREHDARFENEISPLFENAVEAYTPQA